jgi:hypothetical protein
VLGGSRTAASAGQVWTPCRNIDSTSARTVLSVDDALVFYSNDEGRWVDALGAALMDRMLTPLFRGMDARSLGQR